MYVKMGGYGRNDRVGFAGISTSEEELRVLLPHRWKEFHPEAIMTNPGATTRKVTPPMNDNVGYNI